MYYVDISIIMPGGNQCKVRDSFLVNNFTPPSFGMLHDTTVDCGKLPLLINAAYPQTVSYLWSDGFTSPVHYISIPGYYSVEYTYNSKCGYQENFKLSINSKVTEVLLPNIVTPNDDGINDEIDFSKYNFSFLKLEIFNRWGKNVFESDNPNVIWKPICDDGTYFYVAQYRIDCGNATENKTVKGFFSITR